MNSINEEIKELSKQLKKNGIVKTDADALTLARNILQTERKDRRVIKKVEEKEEKIENNLNQVKSESEELNKEVDKLQKVSNEEQEVMKEEEQNIQNKDNFDPSKLEDPGYDITKENRPLKELIEEASKKKENNKENQNKEV